jgi:HemK-related putative methylase
VAQVLAASDPMSGESRSAEPGEPKARNVGQRSPGAAAALARIWLKLRYQVLSRRYRRLVIEVVDGVPLLVLPQVFNPVLLRSGALLARAIDRLPWHEPAKLRVLDLGTGSGIGGIFAARRGASVVAVDINPDAVRCARINALLNGVEERVEVHHGDLFAPVEGCQFDLVLFNPPYYRGVPRDLLDHAWRSPDLFERFAAGLGRVLTPDGCAMLVLSTDGDCAALLAELRDAGFRHKILWQTDLINELVTIHAVRRCGAET